MANTGENSFKSAIYEISQVPDVNFSQFQNASNGDVCKTIWQAFEHIVRSFANMRAGSCAAEIIYAYNPSGYINKQARLRLYLKLYAETSSRLKNLKNLVTSGMLGRFYDFQKVSEEFVETGKLESNCRIVRRDDFIEPLYDQTFNARIPDCYYTVSAFEPNTKNDFSTLDRVLDKISEPVTVRIKIQPEDISAQLHAHTGYLARLGSINRSWDQDYQSCGSFERLDTSENSRLFNNCQAIKPLTCKDPLADDISRQQRKFHESLRQPHLKFDIKILAQSAGCAELISSIVAESAFTKGSYRIVSEKSEALVSSDCHREHDDLLPLRQTATVDELAGLFRLPVASSKSPFCIRKNTDPPFIDPDELIVLGYDDYGIPRGIALGVLKKHFSCLGLPGVGKTTANINIMKQLWAKNIPFLVIESAKTEYRAIKKFSDHSDPSIKKLAEDMRVFIAGGQASPFTLNPLKKLESISTNEHIENVLACFKAVLPVSCGSLPSLLSEATERLYEKFPDSDKPPVMSDLVALVEDVLGSKNYSANTRSDIQTAIEVRLAVLAQLLIGEVFADRGGVDIEDLMKLPAIVELDKLTGEKKCLLTLFIFNLIRTALKAQPNYQGPLRYAIIIEEAHNIFGSAGSVASEEVADPKSQLSDFLYQMMVELRALGVAIILSDQHPSALDPGALKTPVSKLAFHQVHSDDREQLGNSMLFDQVQSEDIARLKPGQAFLFTQGYHYPLKITTINLHEKLELSTIPSDDQLRQIISGQQWFKDSLVRRLLEGLDRFKDSMDLFDSKRVEAVSKIQKLIVQRQKLLQRSGKRAKTEGLQIIIKSLRSLKSKLLFDYRHFLNRTEKMSSTFRNKSWPDEQLAVYAESLFNRLDKTIRPDTEKLLGTVDVFRKDSKKIQFKEQSNG